MQKKVISTNEIPFMEISFKKFLFHFFCGLFFSSYADWSSYRRRWLCRRRWGWFLSHRPWYSTEKQICPKKEKYIISRNIENRKNHFLLFWEAVSFLLLSLLQVPFLVLFFPYASLCTVLFSSLGIVSSLPLPLCSVLLFRFYFSCFSSPQTLSALKWSMSCIRSATGVWPSRRKNR